MRACVFARRRSEPWVQIVYVYAFDDESGALSGAATASRHLVLPAGAG
eukprot:SAG11_NODE_32770_length_281_cov_0.571429_1_plen_47_part_10